MVGGVPSDYLVSTQLQLWLFCGWGCGCCWAVTIVTIYLVSSSKAWLLDYSFSLGSQMNCQSNSVMGLYSDRSVNFYREFGSK